MKVLKFFGKVLLSAFAVLVVLLSVLIYTAPEPKPENLDVPQSCQKNKIVMISSTWCHWCKTAKLSFQASGIEFEEILHNKMLANDADALDSKYSKKGFLGYPFFVLTDKNGKESYVPGWQKERLVQEYCK